ncbi:MAPEG family protein [Lacimicrobium alkaliphilum]|uniref:Membrane protein n=1 Tax=Lacimicrobium alkaliphilum TaxID=1526571 RepID=A0ABQ1RU16_9ALTE|nr:MAPEG family protein [Lacimicrobium alkaliphilum]GGD78826.1 membrane protein [Lacimicrobium alkaliphilum]
MDLLYPMFALVVLTVIVGLLTGYRRISSASAGELDPRYFKVMANYTVPDHIAKFGRNFDNLFEVPVLFYAAGASAMALNIVSEWLLIFAWLFVGFRIIHSLIHITYNNPVHRFVAFLLSFVAVVAMWINIILQAGSVTG